MNLENCSPHCRDFQLWSKDDGPTSEQIAQARLADAIERVAKAGNDSWGQTCELDSEPKLDNDGASYTLLLSTVSVLGLKRQLRAMLAAIEKE